MELGDDENLNGKVSELSDILPELAEMCTSIGIMERGHLIASGKVDEIMQKTKGSQPIHLRVVLSSDEEEETQKESLTRLLKEQPNVEKVTQTEDELLISFNGNDEDAATLLKNLVDANIRISNFYREKEDLESLFLEITGGGKA